MLVSMKDTKEWWGERAEAKQPLLQKQPQALRLPLRQAQGPLRMTVFWVGWVYTSHHRGETAMDGAPGFLLRINLCCACAVSGWQELVDQHLVGSAADHATDQRSDDGNPPVVVRRGQSRVAPACEETE